MAAMMSGLITVCKKDVVAGKKEKHREGGGSWESRATVAAPRRSLVALVVHLNLLAHFIPACAACTILVTLCYTLLHYVYDS
jgi:hypothetical protein